MIEKSVVILPFEDRITPDRVSEEAIWLSRAIARDIQENSTDDIEVASPAAVEDFFRNRSFHDMTPHQIGDHLGKADCLDPWDPTDAYDPGSGSGN